MQAHSGHNRFIHHNTKHRIEALVFFFFFDIDHSTLHPAIVKKKRTNKRSTDYATDAMTSLLRKDRSQCQTTAASDV